MVHRNHSYARFDLIAKLSDDGIKADYVKSVNEAEQAELARLNRVLQVAKQKGNQLFIQNIEREIAAVERGDQSPLIDEYLTDDERQRSSQ